MGVSKNSDLSMGFSVKFTSGMRKREKCIIANRMFLRGKVRKSGLWIGGWVTRICGFIRTFEQYLQFWPNFVGQAVAGIRGGIPSLAAAFWCSFWACSGRKQMRHPMAGRCFLELFLGMLWPETDAASYGWQMLLELVAGNRCGILWLAAAFWS